jgi:TRAP-type mannitol/chloroaromatic compound transport system permease small subunit
MSVVHPIPADGPHSGPSEFSLPHTALSRRFDAVINLVGEASAAIWTVLMLLIVYQVVQRYVFGLGSIKMEEMQWHLYGVGFMLAIPFAEIRQRHVRIDALAEHWPLRRRLWVEVFGIVVFLLPFSLFVLIWSVPYATQSLAMNEISSAPDGLPYRYVLKAFMVATFVLLAMAGVSRLSRVIAALRARQ